MSSATEQGCHWRPCFACGTLFDHAVLGRYGCPQCCGDGMQDASQERLSALVAASGLSISEFARTVVGRDVRTVRRWLNGETEIPESAADWLERASVTSNGKSVQIVVQRVV